MRDYSGGAVARLVHGTLFCLSNPMRNCDWPILWDSHTKYVIPCTWNRPNKRGSMINRVIFFLNRKKSSILFTGPRITTDFWFLSRTRFVNHNSGSGYARKSIKSSSKDADDSQVSKKKLESKIARWVSAQSQVKSAKKSKTCPHCDVTHTKKQKENFLKNLN